MRLFAIAAALTLAPIAFAAEVNFQCPARYPDQLAKLPPGQKWDGAVATVSSGLLLSGGGMITGSPTDDPPAELRGSDEGAYATRYPVGPQPGEARPVQSWLFCSYGQGGEVRLFRRVSEHVSSCVVTRVSHKGRHGINVLASCRK